jgi:hypothetical protein
MSSNTDARSDKTACRELLQCAENDGTLLLSIITGDETWVYGNSKTNVITVEDAVITSAEESKASQSNIKKMLIAFFDLEGLVHYEFLPQGQNMNQTVYRNVLQHFQDAV